MKSTFLKNTLLFCFALGCLIALPAIAQERKNDLIIKRDSSRVECRILLVNDQSVQYKKIRDMDGPVFHTHKSEIAKIVYGNGETEIFTFLPSHSPPPINNPDAVILYPIAPWQIPDFMTNLPYHKTDELSRSIQFYRSKARSTKTAALVVGSLGAAATIAGIILLTNRKEYSSYGYSYSYNDNQEIGTLLTVGGLGAGISVGLIGGLRSRNYKRKALLVEEELAKRKTRSGQLKVHPSFNPFNKNVGLTFALQF